MLTFNRPTTPTLLDVADSPTGLYDLVYVGTNGEPDESSVGITKEAAIWRVNLHGVNVLMPTFHEHTPRFSTAHGNYYCTECLNEIEEG